jgi:hypothetical protein
MSNFDELFLDQVRRDNAQFGIESVYLPNPVFTSAPDYCFIAMEPSLGRMSLDVFTERRKQGFLNFLLSEEDFILQYCAHKFLCNGAFRYAITDISKGAIKVSMATRDRRSRYENWKPLLRMEIEVLGHPKLIAIGGAAREFLKRESFGCEFEIRHFSLQNNSKFSKDYEDSLEKIEAENIEVKLREFANILLEANGYGKDLKNWVLGKVFTKKLSTWKKGLFLNYKKSFSEFAALKPSL